MKRGTCFTFSHSKYEDFSTAACLNLSDSAENVLLIGDSHAATMSLSIRKKLAAENKNFLQATTSNSGFFLNPTGREDGVKLVNYILTEFIPKNHSRISEVIITKNWINAEANELKVKLPELINYLQSFKMKIRVLGQTKTYSISFPTIAAKEIYLSKDLANGYVDDISLQRNIFLKNLLPADIYVDIYDINLTKITTQTEGYVPYMFDDNHLSVFGADQVIDYVDKNKLL
jgi:hypothetical protein